MKPRVNILLPIWGANYVNAFQRAGLRSLLAPRNLPAMVERCETEFVFLVPQGDHRILTENPFFRQLERICPVKFVDIDDLLIDSSLYGYTLTYAYHRGILSAGNRATETHFVFIVSDYVFSENSFDSLSRHIAAGNDVILSSSLRVDADLVGPQLSELADPDEPLAVPARDVLRLAIRHPHPSLETKIVNRSTATDYSTNYQHFYWQVDAQTLLSRNFMSHMLCIRPSRVSQHPVGFCDYTFIPDMAAHTPPAWLDDSDDFFAMELQHRDHEAGFAHSGKRDLQRVADSLSSWTTAEHREFVDHTFVFHAGEIPAALARVKSDADLFVADVRQRLGKEPKSHLNHPHWDPICQMIVERAQERWRRRKIGGDEARKFNFAMQVWGDRYIDVLLNVGLPSQLSTGNLENFPWIDHSVYEVYTTRADAARLRSASVFRWLQVLTEVKIIYIDDQLGPGKWTNVRYCHNEAVKSADAREAALFFLCPDQVWPDGSITNAARLIDEGYTAVMCPGPRAIEEDMVPLLRQGYLSSDETSLNISARELIKFGLDHFHPEMVEWLWDAPEYFGYPSYVMFDVPGQGILAQCYILHPVVVNPEVRNLPEFHVFDQDYLANSCPDIAKIYVAQDSDTVFHFELSPRNVALPPPARPVRPDPEIELMWYGEKQFNRHHRAFAKIPIRIHYAAIDPNLWRPVEERAGQIIARIDRGWDIQDWLLAYRYPDHLIRRLETRYRHNAIGMMPRDQELLERARVVLDRRQPQIVAREARETLGLQPSISAVTERLARRPVATGSGAEGRFVRAADSVAARGQDRTTAKLVTADFNYVVSGHAGAGVMLPICEIDTEMYIHNGTSQSVQVYASGADSIAGIPGSTGVGLPAKSACLFRHLVANSWVPIPLADATSLVPLAQRAAEFDAEYYLWANPDVAESEHDAETHYNRYGWKEGRDPSPYFSVEGYLWANPDIRKVELDPLTHFRLYGIAEGRIGWRK